MADCEYLEECALFTRIRNESIKQFWIDVCCTTPRQDTCTRKVQMKAGKRVPATLLPNGTSVDPHDTVVPLEPEEAMKPAGCEYWEECSRTIFANFQYKSLRAFWANIFCSGPKQEQCARKLLFKAGEEASDTLLPNGQNWDPIETIIMPRPTDD
jgi:hypothetical protein